MYNALIFNSINVLYIMKINVTDFMSRHLMDDM